MVSQFGSLGYTIMGKIAHLTVAFIHLADTFIQSDLCIQAIHFFYVCSLGIEPTTFALLTQCSTTESQAHCCPEDNH